MKCESELLFEQLKANDNAQRQAEHLQHVNRLAGLVDTLALASLQREADLENKPGLVCPSSRGSHTDMDWLTFEKSVKSLRGYFAKCFQLGFQHQGLRQLQRAGIEAEKAMFTATGGVNTHKGAIFTLGLLSAALGWQYKVRGKFDVLSVGRQVTLAWGKTIAKDAQQMGSSTPTHGEEARLQGIPGAREQAVSGFTHLFEYTLPTLQSAQQKGVAPQRAGLEALLATMATLPDTNLVHRGGLEGLYWAQKESGKVYQALKEASANSTCWAGPVRTLADQFEQRWLSPGGSADMLSAAYFLDGALALA